jgi:aconitate hydratase
MLPLIFAEEETYDRIQSSDRLSLTGLQDLTPGEPVLMVIKKKNGEVWKAKLNHTFNAEQINYFKAGSALNLMAQKTKGAQQ